MAKSKDTQDRTRQESKSANARQGERQTTSVVQRSDRQDRERQSSLAKRQQNLPAYGSPFAFMRRFSEEMDRLFGDFGFGRGLAPAFGREFEGFGERWMPQVEVFRRGEELIVRADLPGMSKDDVDVELTDDALVIRGERRSEREENEEGYYSTERSYGSFYRAIPLPEGVNADDANATFRNGVLEIRLPAPEETEERSKRIEIREGVEEEPRARAKAAGQR